MSAEPDRIAAHAEVTTHVADGLAALPQQFRGRAALEALAATWLAQVQDLESAAWGLYGLAIDNSSAHALDQVGALLGQSRPSGLLDVAYRSVLRAVVKTLHSSGTGEDLLAIMRELAGGTYDFTLTEAFPASVVLRPDDPQDISAEVMLGVLRRGAAAGVALQVIDVPDEDRFRFSSSTEEVVASSSHGLGDSTGVADGGALVGVVST